MARDYFKKLWSTILSNGVRLDSDGNWTIINSSTNKRRMQGKGSGVGGPSGKKQKVWVPAKIFLTPQELEEKAANFPYDVSDHHMSVATVQSAGLLPPSYRQARGNGRVRQVRQLYQDS